MRQDLRHDDERRDSATLREHLAVIGRRKWVILMAVLLAPSVAVLASLSQKRLYQASAEVLLTQQNLPATLTGTPDVAGSQDPERVAQTQADLARVPRVARRVLREAGIRDENVEEFLDSSGVEAKQNSDLLVFRVTSPRPSVAVRLATEYAVQFTLFRRELDTAALARARREVREQLSRLEARGDRRSPLYATLVNKEQQLRTLEALQTSNAVLAQRAVTAKRVQPRPVRNGVLALLLGLLLGTGLAFLLEAIDTRVRSAEEIARFLGLPLLARIPEPSRRLRDTPQLAMLGDPEGAHAEAIRMLRTNLEFVNLERSARTIIVSSAVEQEGKSTTVGNLAVAFARSGRRVVLVDLDLRRPFLARLFELGDVPGLTDVALGRVNVEQAIQRVAVDGRPPARGGRTAVEHNGRGDVDGVLEVVTSGPIPPDPGEFIGTRALGEVLRHLRERAEIVLIDSPPLLRVGDAMALSAKVDGLIVVTRIGVIRRGMVKELRRLLEASPAAKLGFVVAGADAEEAYGYEPYSYRTTEHAPKDAVR